MAAVFRSVHLAFVLALAVAGCASEPDKQWYKPGGSYTMADFESDRKACTKSRELDEACLKQRGWIAVSPDKSGPTVKDPPKRY
jgi:hypothetical protein